MFVEQNPSTYYNLMKQTLMVKRSKTKAPARVRKNPKKAVTNKEKYNKKQGQRLTKSNSLKEISAGTGIPVQVLRKIKKRGMAAYRSNPGSVRKGISGPQQWGMARVYASIRPGSKSAKADADLLQSK
jgi:hypothetical protein